MKSNFIFSLVILFISVQHTVGQVALNADGPGDTYELITAVLAPNQNPIEVPDCNHDSFGRHIDEVFDAALNKNVFRFFIHTDPDNDRCRNFDRQRNEIKSYDKSTDDLLGVEGERVFYSWKFKLNEGFQSSPNFTHLHQLKSVGGPLESMPMYTLTTRKSSPDRIELRYAETDKQITLAQTPLEPLIGHWLAVEEMITYGNSGTYAIQIKKVDDETVLFEYEAEDIINWRPDAEFVRPKWGIYRSLINAQDLRDEEVLYADFYIEELGTTSDFNTAPEELLIYPNPVNDILTIDKNEGEFDKVTIYRIDGTKVFQNEINSSSDRYDIDVSSLQRGAYMLSLERGPSKLSKLFVIAR